MMNITKKIAIFAALAVASLCFSLVTAEAKDASILILSNQGVKQYDKAIESFKQELTAKSITATYTLIDENDSEKGKAVKSQFEKLKQALPKITKVGMLYDAKTKTAMKDEAQAAANALGLELIAKPINSKADVASALDDLMGEAQCLWAGVDTMVYNAQSSKYILLTTLRNKIPFMAFSSNYVNAGALMALEADYDDIGRQSADLAIKILNGQNPGSLPVETPRKVKMLTNQNTADVIGVAIPQELVE
jgi:ABC-type uncharacterized transport system substrate-binding protein